MLITPHTVVWDLLDYNATRSLLAKSLTTAAAMAYVSAAAIVSVTQAGRAQPARNPIALVGVLGTAPVRPLEDVYVMRDSLELFATKSSA